MNRNQLIAQANTIQKQRRIISKLKELMLLTDSSVSDVVTGDLQARQWDSFLGFEKEIEGEEGKYKGIKSELKAGMMLRMKDEYEYEEEEWHEVLFVGKKRVLFSHDNGSEFSWLLENIAKDFEEIKSE